jgi:hypothetical protein
MFFEDAFVGKLDFEEFLGNGCCGFLALIKCLVEILLVGMVYGSFTRQIASAYFLIFI